MGITLLYVNGKDQNLLLFPYNKEINMNREDEFKKLTDLIKGRNIIVITKTKKYPDHNPIFNINKSPADDFKVKITTVKNREVSNNYWISMDQTNKQVDIYEIINIKSYHVKIVNDIEDIIIFLWGENILNYFLKKNGKIIFLYSGNLEKIRRKIINT